MTAVLPELRDRIARVTCWRENIPTQPTDYDQSKLAAAIEITDLRIQFKIKRALTKTPDQADITITNLSELTRHDLETKPLQVQIEAGYVSTGPRLLFVGDLRFGMTELKSPNWETLLQVGDGADVYQNSKISRAYQPGTTILSMLQDTSKSMGMTLPPGLAQDPALRAQIIHGDIAHGPARDRLTHLLTSYGYSWSIQNGKPVILRDDQVHSLAPIPVDEEHGMIGTPEFGSPPKSGKPPHVTVEMLLYPEMMPGALIQLTSKVKNGLFRVEDVEHHGDTHGAPWTTKIEISPAPKPSPLGSEAPPESASDRVVTGKPVLFGTGANAVFQPDDLF